MSYITREASIEDVTAIKEIFNEGIEDRIATLETTPRTDEDMKEWLLNRSKSHKVLVIENENKEVLGWASLNVFNSRCCYSGVVDISIYIRRNMRGKGLGKLLLGSLINTAKEEGFHKLILSTFKFNELGQGLYKSMGFREVGTYMEQGILDGKFIDVTIMEKILNK